MRYLQLLRLLVLVPFLSWASDVEMENISEERSNSSQDSYKSVCSQDSYDDSNASTQGYSSSSTSSESPPPTPIQDRDENNNNDFQLSLSLRLTAPQPTINSDNIPQRWPTLSRPAKAYIVCQALLELVPPALVGLSYNGDPALALAALFADCALMGGRLVYGCVLNHPQEGWFKKFFRHAFLQSFAAISTLAAWDYYNFIQDPAAHPQSFGWGGSFGSSLSSMLLFFVYGNNQE